MEQTSKQLLFARLDENIRERTRSMFMDNAQPDIKDIYELQLLSELHYYLKTEHPFTPAETEALLSFKDPLNVARWCSEERGHPYSFPICELLDKIKAYDRFEQLLQEKTSLRERLQKASRIVKDRPAQDKPDRGGEAR